ncbi:MAG: hypothetical protein MJ048_00590 [Acidaminococcaceae bacterium]|nr:hypothetical protein [Acidaminococcaceae bacterium]
MSFNFGKKDFLNLLQDEEVRQEINNIVRMVVREDVVATADNSENYADAADAGDGTTWKDKYYGLSEEFEQYKAKAESELKTEKEKAYEVGESAGKKSSDLNWDEKCKNIKSELETKHKQELSSKDDEISRLQSKLKSRFEDVARVYEEYEDNEEMKKGLKGFFSQKGFEAFVVTLSQESSIENIWEKCKDNRNDPKVLSELWKLFLCSVRLVNLSKGSQFKYSVLNPRIGEKFDEDEHVGIGKSKAQGKISKVILPGYKQGKSIKQKSNVEVQ